MGTIFSLSLSSSILLACLYLAYRWTMANERLFILNRVTLYIIYIFSFTAPFSYHLVTFLFSSKINSEVTIGIDLMGISTGLVREDQPTWINVLLWIYVIGIGCATIRFLYSIIKIISIIRKGKRVDGYSSFQLIITDQQGIAPFSFLKYIVISKEDFNKSFSTILLHEQTHLRQQHWIDLMVANIVAIFLWYNPAAWLMIEEFKFLHEYQADESVIDSGADIKKYQYLLIEKAVGERLPSPANSLNHSKLKKRLTMMYKQKPRTLRRVASLATIPALFAGFAIVNSPAVASVLSEANDASLFTQSAYTPPSAPLSTQSESHTENNGKVTNFSSHSEEFAAQPAIAQKPDKNVMVADKKKDKVHAAVEKMAEYPGGMIEMMKFLIKNIKYPENAVKNDIQGRVVVKFIVTKNGKVEDPTIVKGLDPELDAEALRVVALMPNWTPAQNNGKPVDSWFTIPVSFKLNDDEKATTEE